MPIRIQPNRPYYPRIYLPRPTAARAPAAARAGRGTPSGGEFTPPDVTPTGYWPTDLGKAINAIAQTYQQNKLANRLMNTENPPRAGAVGPVLDLSKATIDPKTGQPVVSSANQISSITPTAGTAPQTGGVQEFQVQQQVAADEAAQRTAALNEQMKKAQIARALSQDPLSVARIASLNRPKAVKSGKYVPGSGDVQNDPGTDDFNQIAADFDAQHGKGSYNGFTKNLSNLVPDGRGNLIVAQRDENGEVMKDPKTGNPIPVMGKDGITPQYSIPATDANHWMNRYNAARIRNGQDYLGNLPDGVNQDSGVASGSSQINPIPVKTNLDARALPDKTWIQLPDGSTKQIQRTPTSATAPAPAAPEPATSTDTSDQVQSDLEAEDQTDQNLGTTS